MRELKARGCHFALDDFGSGLSSFMYLKTLPVDYLKIDGQFVENVNRDQVDRNMVEAISQVGKTMGIQTIAERVESAEVLAELARLGIGYPGFSYCRAAIRQRISLPARAAAKVLSFSHCEGLQRSVPQSIKRGLAMMLGMSLATFTQFHVIISLIGIGSGILVLIGMLQANLMPKITAVFLATTVATSVTGFMFPFTSFGPPEIVGLISLIVLIVAILALYSFKLAGSWRWVYVASAMIALYLNCFVLVAQAFRKCRSSTPWRPPRRNRRSPSRRASSCSRS